MTQTSIEHHINSTSTIKTNHNNDIKSVVYIPDTTNIVSASHDGTLKIWDYKEQKLIQTLKGHSDRVY